MTAPKFEVYDPIAEFTRRLRLELVADGVIDAADADDRVAYGPALEMRQEDAPRVWVDLVEDFTVTSPSAGAVNTGYGLREEVPQEGDGDTLDEEETRSLWTVQDGMVITIMGRIPESGEEDAELRGDAPALLSRTAVFQLRARVLKAVYHLLKIGASQVRGKWIRPEDGEFMYGAACALLINIATEVPDEPRLIAKPAGEATMTAELPEGDYAVATLVLTPNIPT